MLIAPKLLFPMEIFLFSLLTGVFAPTLFSKAYGDLVCDSCTNVTQGNGTRNGSGSFVCHSCHYDLVIRGAVKHAQSHVHLAVMNADFVLFLSTEKQNSVPQPRRVSFVLFCFLSYKCCKVRLNPYFTQKDKIKPDPQRKHSETVIHASALPPSFSYVSGSIIKFFDLF